MRPARHSEKLKYLSRPNSGPTTKTQEDERAEIGTAAGAKDIAGQRAVLPALQDSEKERVIVLGQASALGWCFRFRRSGFPIVEAYNRRGTVRTSARLGSSFLDNPG